MNGVAAPVLTDRPLRFHWTVALGFAALCVAVSYPGRLNADSLFSVIAARMPGADNNWHSATLGWFWSLPAGRLGQPLAGLVMQAALFGCFAGFLPRLPATPRGRITLALELLLRVVLAAGVGYIGKDAVVVTTLLIAVQLLRRTARDGFDRPRGLALGAIGLLFLLGKAPNFLIIVVALALVLPFFIRSRGRYGLIVGAALVVGTLAVPLNRTVDRYVFAARDLHPDKQLVLFDLAGISVQSGENAFAAVDGWPTAALPSPAACYLPYMWDSFAPWAPCGGYSRAYDRMDDALTRRWVAAIMGHPLAYARHRIAYTGALLRSQDHATWGIAGQSINDATAPAALTEMRAMTDVMHADHPIRLWHPSATTAPFKWLETVLFRFPKVQWLGLIACLAVLLGGWMRRAQGVRLGAILAAAFGVGNFAMLTVFGVADPGRYMWPTVALAYVALLSLLAPSAAEA